MIPKIIIEKELLISLYWGNQYSTVEIKRIFNCSRGAIRNRMNEYNIARRCTLDSVKVRGYIIPQSTRDKLSKEYKGKSLAERWEKEKAEQARLKSSKSRIGFKVSQKTKSKLSKINSKSITEKGHCIKTCNCFICKAIRNNCGLTSNEKKLRSSSVYAAWRIKVLKRDDYTCQICHSVGKNLQAHHIKSFAKYPKLRLNKNNGITLCKDCHHWIHHIDQLDFQ